MNASLFIRILLLTGLIGFPFGVIHGNAEDGERRGALVMAFDDGFPNWLEIAAPELRAAGGAATAFVNNQYVPGRIRFEDLRRLRDEFGWEIGTHSFHHQNARSYVRAHGLAAWEREQLVASISQFAEEGLETNVLAFPYNVYDAELAAAALRHVRSFRRAVPMALVKTLPPGGVHPATSIDIAAHVPVPVLESWVDAAARNQSMLFLYAHRILPDEFFVTGVVHSVEGGTLVAEAPVALPDGAETWMLVPDVERRMQRDGGLLVRAVEEKRVHVAAADLSGLTRPGATFMIGPASATRLSDFRALLQRARDKNLRFLRVGDTLQAAEASPEAERSRD